jgi:hypothetical protein
VCGARFAWGARAASAAVQVDDDKAQCPKAGFRTISGALAFVAPGATVVVCPGRYSGPLRMTKPGVSVAGLTGNRRDVVLLPGFSPSGIVEMSAPTTTLANVTLRDRDPLTCFRFGVVVDNGPAPLAEAALIENVTVRQDIGSIHDCPFFANGTGVEIGGPEAGAVPGPAAVHRSTILGRSDGVAVFAGSTAVIRHNVIGRVFGARFNPTARSSWRAAPPASCATTCRAIPPASSFSTAARR